MGPLRNAGWVAIGATISFLRLGGAFAAPAPLTSTATNITVDANQRVEYNYEGFLAYGIETFYVPLVFALSILVLEDMHAPIYEVRKFEPPRRVPPVGNIAFLSTAGRTRVKNLVDAIELLAGQLRVDAKWMPFTFTIFGDDESIFGSGEVDLHLRSSNPVNEKANQTELVSRRDRAMDFQRSRSELAARSANVDSESQRVYSYEWVSPSQFLDEAKVYNLLAIVLAEQLPFSPNTVVHSFTRRSTQLGVQVRVQTGVNYPGRMYVRDLVGGLWFLTEAMWQLSR